MSENPQKILFEKILNYSITLLSAREYSEKLLQEKIEKKFIEPKTYYRKHSNSYHTTKEKTESEISEIREISGQVIEFLTEKKYLDEHRTAENFLRYRREYSPRGKRMIAQDMYKKKIDPEISEQVLAEFSEEEEQKDCIMLAQKKWAQITQNVTSTGSVADTQKAREKLTRFLAGKGFPYSMIKESLTSVIPEF